MEKFTYGPTKVGGKNTGMKRKNRMTDKKLDPMFTKVKRPASQKQIEANRRNGKLGGQVTGVKKGFAAIDPETHKQISSKGGNATKVNREEAN